MLDSKRLMRLVVCLAPAGCVAVLLTWFLLASYPSAEAQQAVPTTAEPNLKVYLCEPAMAQATAARLREEFRGVGGVHIAADDRLGRIVIQAPPEIQAEIARRLASPPPSVTPQPDRRNPSAPAAQPVSVARGPSVHSVQLRNTTSRQVEFGLVDTLGKRLTPAPARGPGGQNYRLALPGGGALDVNIDYRANVVTVRGTGVAVDSCVRLIQALDSPPQPAGRTVRLVSLLTTSPASVRLVANAIGGGAATAPSGRLASTAVQPPEEEEQPEENAEAPPVGPPGQAPGAQPPAAGQPKVFSGGEAGLIGPVQIETLPGLDVLIITGHQRDVERVMQIIQQVEKLSAETEPVILVRQLRHVNSEALATLITPLYEQVYQPRQGAVSITALVTPNALLLVGRKENVQTALKLIQQLDRPMGPEAEFQVFGLRHAAATTAQTAITQFFGEQPAQGAQPTLAPRVVVVADYRSNSLIVRASPRDMLEVAKLIERIDTPTVPAVNELRVFNLYNSTAESVAQILEEAIRGQAAPGAAPGAAAAQAGQEAKSVALQFVTIDTKGQRRLRSGILTDVRITPNASANTLVVSGPADSMELIEAVIRQLDQTPVAEAQIKVFHIVNGDAPNLTTMLESLFAPSTTGEPSLQIAAPEGQSSLVALRFVADARTNSIIASGTAYDLLIVDAILTRLDESVMRQRQTQVYRLKNVPADNVATAIITYLQQERNVMTQIAPEMMSPYEQVQREVVIVPEVVTNTLIVSATPRYFKEVEDILKQLDERPPMVMIQVLIAEVTLNNTDEFGVELGLQDSVLFDRSKLENLNTITTTTSSQQPNGATVSTQTQSIVSADNTPGFAFNNTPLGNSGADKALASARLLGTQGLSTFGLNRVNSDLGYGGLVLSASSDVVSILMRALKEQRRLEVLSRPQIMTLDNQPAQIMVGQRVPMVTSTTITTVGQNFAVTPQEVGLIVGVRPRISPDNVVVMIIDAVKAEVGPEAEGIPISISATGQVVRQPRINRTSAETTVLAADGQTIVLGGLITKSKTAISRRVPFMGDLPLVGALFRYDGNVEKKTELLIIMTPHVVRNPEDADRIKQVEAARMSWCLCDVLKLTGDAGLRGRSGEWPDSETHVVYPDLTPGAAETIPVPDAAPGPQPTIAPPGGGPFIPQSSPGPRGALPQPTPAPLPAEPPVAPSPQASSGTSPVAAGTGPSGAGWNRPLAAQARYLPPVYPAAGQQVIYQPVNGPPPPPYSGPGTAVQLGYAAPAPQNPWPPTAPPRQPPPAVAEPAYYDRPYQPPTAQPQPMQPPLYR
jgi:general secretion pathway protein D